MFYFFFFLSRASDLLLACAWMHRVSGVCATVCEEGRWCSSRNHLSTLGCTAGGVTVCMCVYIYMCVCICVCCNVLHSRQGPVYKDIFPDLAFGLCHKHSRLLCSMCVCVCVYQSSKRKQAVKSV